MKLPYERLFGIVIAFLVCMSFLWSIYAILRERRSRRRLLKNRAPLELHEIYTTFYYDTGLDRQAWEDAWQRVSDILGVEAKKLRPSDDWISLNTFRFQITTDIDDLDTYVLVQAGKTTLSPQEPLKTVDDVVRFLAIAQKSRAIKGSTNVPSNGDGSSY